MLGFPPIQILRPKDTDNTSDADILTRSQGDARYVNEGQATSITAAMISSGAVTGAKLATNAVGTNQIADAAITTAKLSATVIRDLLGLQLAPNTVTIGNASSSPTRVALNAVCSAGKTAIACSFATEQNKWHIETATPSQDRCSFGLTTCIYLQGGGFVCPFSQETVTVTATCVQSTAL